MIEFDGYISGNAYKYFFKRLFLFTNCIFYIGVIFFMPFAIILASSFSNWSIIAVYCLIFIVITLSTSLILLGKKNRQGMIPKRIFTEEERIVSISDKYIDYKFIDDVKKVRDHGEFYELVFPFGKISEKYICQKNLLTKGTLEEFESLFDGKIIRLAK